MTEYPLRTPASHSSQNQK